MRIYLVGFMGAGKTTVGRSLASRLGWPFLDLDSEVEERAGMTIPTIFEREGEQAFRQLERDALVVTLDHPRVVVATGGGTVTSETNAELIRSAGLSLWLNPPFASIARRIGSLGKTDRPLFRSESQAFELYRQRLPAYRRCDMEIEIGVEEAPEEVAARITLMLQERRCGT